jgi:predicted dinucleotide-binding enzyme
MSDVFPAGTIVSVLGGTGPQGRGLARRFAAAGIPVVIGSRSPERAAETATALTEAVGGTVSGADNATAASQGDVVVVAVPWDGHAELLRDLKGQLAGKVVVDCVNPLGFDKQGPFALPVEEGSAAMQARVILQDSTVVGAFQATDLVQALASSIPGVRGVYGGRLRNCHQVEALTANLIAVNRRYKAHAGIRVSDLR